MSGGATRERLRFADEHGVFVPGLMGAGILISMAMLVADGVRKIVPVDGARSRAARATAAARGRAADLASVARGETPRPSTVQRVPRGRSPALVLALVASGFALAVFSATWELYEAETGVLAKRGWTLAFGFILAGVLAAAAALWVAVALSGRRGPRWWQRVAGWGLFGTLPAPERVTAR